MKIWHKLLLLPSTAALAFAAVLVVNHSLGRQSAAVVEQVAFAMQLTAELEQHLLVIPRMFQDAAQAGELDLLDGVEERRGRLEALLDRGGSNAALDSASMAALKKSFAAYYPLAYRVTKKLIANVSGTSDEASLADVNAMQAATAAMQRRLEETREANARLIRQALEQSRAVLARARLWTVVVGGLCLAALLMVAGWLFSGITRSLRAVAGGLGRMTEGDFSEPVPLQGGDELTEMGRRVNLMGDYLREMAEVATQIAGGQLDVELQPRSARDSFGRAFQQMIASLRAMVGQVQASIAQINKASVHMMASSQQHEKGAAQQASAVEEALRTIRQLVESNREISATARNVLANAEMTHNTNELLAERIGNLAGLTDRIAEILAMIKDIANKSELLALNAGLEGIKAGEAGRGFSLVAAEMQRLAENVMGAVANIKALTSDIREASTASVMATEQGTKVAKDTTSSAERIGLIIQQQQISMENVSNAITDVSRVARDIAAGASQSLASIKSLRETAEQQQRLVAQFRVQEAAKASR